MTISEIYREDSNEHHFTLRWCQEAKDLSIFYRERTQEDEEEESNAQEKRTEHQNYKPKESNTLLNSLHITGSKAMHIYIWKKERMKMVTKQSNCNIETTTSL